MDTIDVLIVDDDELIRDGLRWMLKDHQQIQVVGEATNGQQALERVSTLLPSVVLMDIDMPIMDGLEATRRLKAEHPDIHVVIIGGCAGKGSIIEALCAGASAYLLKQALRELLFYTINAVISGAFLVDAALLRQAIGGTRDVMRARVGDMVLMEPLNGSERKILQLLAEGETNKEIGQALGYAEVTVKKHVQVILAKLHVADRTHAATMAVRLGLIS